MSNISEAEKLEVLSQCYKENHTIHSALNEGDDILRASMCRIKRRAYKNYSEMEYADDFEIER